MVFNNAVDYQKAMVMFKFSALVYNDTVQQIQSFSTFHILIGDSKRIVHAKIEYLFRFFLLCNVEKYAF